MWRRIGLGHMGMSAAEFWDMTLLEWNDAVDGLAEKNGASLGDGFDSDDLAEMMEQYPDG